MMWSWILLFGLLAGDSTSWWSKETVSEAAINRLRTMTPTQQQEWILRLEKRHDRANRILSKAEDAEKDRQRIASLLRQKELTSKYLSSLIEKTDQKEKNAVASLTRTYQGLLYSKFSKQEERLTEYRHVWGNIYKAWQDAKEPFEQQDRLIDWLQSANRTLSTDARDALPEAPTFSPDPVVKKTAPQVKKEKADSEDRSIAKSTPTSEEPKKDPEKREDIPQPSQETEKQEHHEKEVEKKETSEKKEAESSTSSKETEEIAPTSSSKKETEEITPTSSSKTEKKPTPSESVQVNRGELSARIAGLNLRLKALEMELHEEDDIDIEQLTSKFNRLKTMVQQRKELVLFWNLLSEEDRRGVEKFRSLRGVIAQMGQKIFDLRSRYSEENTSSPGSSSSTTLDRLSKDLAGLTIE